MDLTCTVIGGKSMLYQSTKHRDELKLSGHIPNCTMSNLFWEFAQAFFHWLNVKFLNKWSGEKQKTCSLFLTTLVLCSSCFLHALQQNRAQSRLLYLLSMGNSRGYGSVTQWPRFKSRPFDVWLTNKPLANNISHTTSKVFKLKQNTHSS